jgi:hypothetical protein
MTTPLHLVTPTEGASPDRAFLELFAERDRTAVAQYFYQRAREGAGTPLSITIRVAAHVGARLTQAWGDGIEHRRQQAYLDALVDHFNLALGFSQHVLKWEALPAEQREAIKSERGRVYQREAMLGQPPTEKQIGYLARLGWTGAVPESKAAASALIDRLVSEGYR